MQWIDVIGPKVAAGEVVKFVNENWTYNFLGCKSNFLCEKWLWGLCL